MTRGKRPVGLDLVLPFELTEHSLSTKHQLLCRFLEHLISSGRLPSGEALPSTRTLAQRWGVSRGTLETVFDQLREEGFIIRKRGAGSVVCATLPDNLIAATRTKELQVELDTHRSSDSPAPITYLQPYVPFIARLADPGLLEEKDVKLLCTPSAKDLATAVSASSLGGDENLRKSICDHIQIYRGIDCSPQDIVITHGIRHCLDLISRVLGKEAVVAMEDPGYYWARRIFNCSGNTIIDIPVDEAGLIVEALSPASPVQAIYVTPSHQAPLGVCMSMERRKALLASATAANAIIIEDDYDSEYNYGSAPLPAIKSIDTNDRVIFCGSFNKTLFSNFRLGFMVIPKHLQKKVINLFEDTGQTPGILGQLALNQFLCTGKYVRHLRISRQTYQHRRDLLISKLRENPDLQISGEQSGLHFVLWLPADIDEREFCARAALFNLCLQPVSAFTSSHAVKPGVLIGYAALTDTQINQAAASLLDLVKSFTQCTERAPIG